MNPNDMEWRVLAEPWVGGITWVVAGERIICQTYRIFAERIVYDHNNMLTLRKLLNVEISDMDNEQK